MEKQLGFRLKAAVVTVAVVIASLLVQALIFSAAGSLSHAGGSFFSLFAVTVSRLLLFSIPIILILAVLLFLSLTPLKQALRQILTTGAAPDASIAAARKSLFLLQRRIVFANLIGYLAGSIVSVAVSGDILHLESLVGVLYAIASALLFAMLQVAIDNVILEKPRALLGIHTIDENARRHEPGVIFRSMATGMSLLAYVLLTMLQIGMVLHSGDPTQARASAVLLLLIVVLLALGAVIYYLSARAQVVQLSQMRDELREIVSGSGSLSNKVSITHFDEFGEIADLINRHVDSLAKLIREIEHASSRVANSSNSMGDVIAATSTSVERMLIAANEVSTTAHSNMQTVQASGNQLAAVLKSLDTIADNVNVQASFVEQTSSAVNEFAASIESVTRATSKANELATSLLSVAQDGSVSVGSSVEAIRQIETSSREVNAIVGVISKIAAQTNLLAMNAAIEASHAGDAGRGFAVVAEEVRNLAEHSSVSAKEITTHLKDMAKRVENGVRRSEATGLALNRISSDVNQTTALVGEISSAMQEQNSGTKEILDSINSLVNATTTIRNVVFEQKEKNEILRTALESVVLAFTQIQEAAHNQSQGTTDIAHEIQHLRSVSMENQQIVNELATILGRYRLSADADAIELLEAVNH
ncbi:MAG TPA: methyl-accepting chemotaxis protein [Spirochaetia bacterium]|nr:methyl-accepting chemotaxis protein [Spirochaetia bacterium]